jgi:hypothetical protein
MARHHSHSCMSRRCSVEKCTKLGKDEIDGKIICRIHSPMRKGWEERNKLVKKVK